MSTPPFLTLPTGVHRREITTGRGGFAALEAAPPDGAATHRPALLVPGFTGSKEDFIAVLQPLAAVGRRVVAIDMRGQYETPGADAPEAYTRAALGADIAAVLATFGQEPVHLLGHSFGGLVARETVLADPTPVTSFTLMSSGPGAVGGQRESDGRRLLAALPEMGVRKVWELSLEPDAVARGVPPEIVAFLRERMFSNCVTGLAEMGREVLTAPDRVGELAAVASPMLVLHGDSDDAWSPQEQASMARQLAARHVVIPDAAHSPAIEAVTATVAALTDFWNDAED